MSIDCHEIESVKNKFSHWKSKLKPRMKKSRRKLSLGQKKICRAFRINFLKELKDFISLLFLGASTNDAGRRHWNKRRRIRNVDKFWPLEKNSIFGGK
jgi:hypothetical protein